MKLLTNGKFRAILALLTVVVVMAYLFVVSFSKLPEGTPDYVHFILGLLSGILKDIYGYFFGNADKNQPDNPTTPNP